MDVLAVIDTKKQPATPISTQARDFIASAMADSTRRAYRSDARIFVEWCESQQVSALPADAETVANFLSEQARLGIKPSTLDRRLAAIRAFHESANLPIPNGKLVSSVVRGIKRQLGDAPKRKKALTVDMLYRVLAQIDVSSVQGLRDRAILLLGFSGAFRRSELATLRFDDLEFVPDGLKVLVRRSKTDKFAEGETVGIYSQRLKIVEALRDYMTIGGVSEGALFRPITKGGKLRNQFITDQSVADIVKRYTLAAGFNPDEFGGHSLRSGFVTTALEGGAGMFRVMDVTRHKSVQTLKGYAREADMFRNHAGQGFL